MPRASIDPVVQGSASASNGQSVDVAGGAVNGHVANATNGHSTPPPQLPAAAAKNGRRIAVSDGKHISYGKRGGDAKALQELAPARRNGISAGIDCGYDMRPLGLGGVALGVVASGGDVELHALRAKVAELKEENERLRGEADAPQDNVLMQQYLRQHPAKMLKGRLPWLVVLLLIQSVAAVVMRSFDELLEREIVIAFFVPMIVGTGGNAGNQPGVAVTRALGLGSVDTPTLWKIARKELGLGLVTSSILAACAFGRVLLTNPHNGEAAFAIALAVFIMINLAIALGVGFSIAMDRYNIDPANGAAPLLTTLTDLTGIVILCAIAYAFFADGLANPACLLSCDEWEQQRVLCGEAACAPEDPFNDLLLGDG